MNYSIMRVFLFIYGMLLFAKMHAQEPIQTIKVKKFKYLKEAQYDNTEYKLIAIDRYGNPKEDAIKSFELHYSLDGKLHRFISYSNKLSPEMLQSLKELKLAQKIFFTKIKAEDDAGHAEELPDVIEMHFPDCKKVNKKK
jgi:hypothetical protein